MTEIVTVASSAKQINSASYWREGLFTERVLIHLGSAPTKGSTIDDILTTLKAKPLSPLPRAMNLHWEVTFDLSNVINQFSKRGYRLISPCSLEDRIVYHFERPIEVPSSPSIESNGVSAVELNGSTSSSPPELTLLKRPSTNGIACPKSKKPRAIAPLI